MRIGDVVNTRLQFPAIKLEQLSREWRNSVMRGDRCSRKQRMDLVEPSPTSSSSSSPLEEKDDLRRERGDSSRENGDDVNEEETGDEGDFLGVSFRNRVARKVNREDGLTLRFLLTSLAFLRTGWK